MYDGLIIEYCEKNPDDSFTTVLGVAVKELQTLNSTLKQILVALRLASSLKL